MGDLYSIHPGILKHPSSSSSSSSSSEISDLVKAQIASHPRYPSLLCAFIACRKVGAPPEMAAALEEISKRGCATAASVSGKIGADPELDEFMETYCRVLQKYREELSKPFDEAATFLAEIEARLGDLCKCSDSTATAAAAAVACSVSDEAAGSSDEEERSYGDIDTSESQDSGSHPADQDLKEMLLKKYSGYLSNLKKEFLKKKKKGKLPKDARLTLLDWWNAHYRWPYPTDEEKMRLAEMTGLEPKQINNWFINQRKRHWKPSEDMRFALHGGGGAGETMLYFDSGAVGP